MWYSNDTAAHIHYFLSIRSGGVGLGHQFDVFSDELAPHYGQQL